MEEQNDFPIAHLQANQLEQIRKLEHQLNDGTAEKIILIAYQHEEH